MFLIGEHPLPLWHVAFFDKSDDDCLGVTAVHAFSQDAAIREALQTHFPDLANEIKVVCKQVPEWMKATLEDGEVGILHVGKTATLSLDIWKRKMAN